MMVGTGILLETAETQEDERIAVATIYESIKAQTSYSIVGIDAYTRTEPF